MDDDRRRLHHNGALLAADGTPRLPHVAYDDDGYAYSDGAPLAQNDTQAEQLFYAFPALRAFVRRRFPGAYAACDMLIYPERGGKGARAPDIFVAFGAGDVGPEGSRRNSYKLFAGEPVPRFVLEVLSGTTADEDLGPKREDYAKWGIEECWLFDPFGKDIARFISAERLVASAGCPERNEYAPIDPLAGTQAYRSDVLGLELRAEGGMLRIRDPETGEDLRGLDEEVAAREAAEKRVAAEVAARKAVEVELAELRRARGNVPPR
jgi:hypothetical protein